MEFLGMEAVQEAILLNESELHGQQLKVLPRRSNVPGMKQYRAEHFNPYMGFPFRRLYVPHFSSPYGGMLLNNLSFTLFYSFISSNVLIDIACLLSLLPTSNPLQ